MLTVLAWTSIEFHRLQTAGPKIHLKKDYYYRNWTFCFADNSSKLQPFFLFLLSIKCNSWHGYSIQTAIFHLHPNGFVTSGPRVYQKQSLEDTRIINRYKSFQFFGGEGGCPQVVATWNQLWDTKMSNISLEIMDEYQCSPTFLEKKHDAFWPRP